MFNGLDAERICSLSLGSTPRDDFLAWRFTKDGIYSAKSWYEDVLRRGVDGVGRIVDVNWTRLWKLKVIPKIHQFLWRVMHGILPTCTNLIGRFFDIQLFCKWDRN